MIRLRRRALALMAVGIAVLVGIVAFGSPDASPYRVDMRLESAGGLRKGSEVRIGGVPIGKVSALGVDAKDAVEVELALDSGRRIGRGAAASISATNLIGEKYVDLDPGDLRRPLPTGTSIAARRVTTSTDLDQVVDVLDADTRTRLTILINEAGFGLTGRKTDFAAFLKRLPTTLAAGRKVLDRAVSDNRSLGTVVDRSDEAVGQLVADRSALNRVLRGTADSATAVAEKRRQLDRTLAKAPATLSALQGFLRELEATTEPLGPAARRLTASAAPLRRTLEQLRPFDRAARPALREARRASPALTRLGRRAEPTVREALPTVASLNALLSSSGPSTRTLKASVDDLLGTAEGWARSIQLRDGLSHVFRGRALLSTNTIDNLVRTLLGTPDVPADAKALGTKRTRGTGLLDDVLDGALEGLNSITRTR